MPRRDDVYRITEALPGTSIDRRFRTRRYLISMGIRTACFLSLLFVHGWLQWVMFVAALVLPYISVILANDATVERRIELMPPLVLKDTDELPAGHPDRTAPTA
jgi:hypothetical protein